MGDHTGVTINFASCSYESSQARAARGCAAYYQTTNSTVDVAATTPLLVPSQISQNSLTVGEDTEPEPEPEPEGAK
jgi:hypothetical protein